MSLIMSYDPSRRRYMLDNVTRKTFFALKLTRDANFLCYIFTNHHHSFQRLISYMVSCVVACFQTSNPSRSHYNSVYGFKATMRCILWLFYILQPLFTKYNQQPIKEMRRALSCHIISVVLMLYAFNHFIIIMNHWDNNGCGNNGQMLCFIRIH